MTAPLAVSLGDPAGIAPEVIAESWVRRREMALPPFFVVGGAAVLRAAAATRGIDLPVASISAASEAASVFGSALPVLGGEDCAPAFGEPTIEGAALALHSLTKATALALSGEAGGVVTGPIAKSKLAAVGFTQPGQTEFLADACGLPHEAAVMMLAGPSLRTVPLTVHEALAAVPGLVTRDLIESKARIVARALARDFGLPSARIAITGLNPHAGEDGRMGTEDRDVIVPAIAALQAEGLAVTGPHPADALFAAHAREGYDVALCMYHDQALIPIKTLDFDQGVNVTLGLPIVRTSPDHGTAFAIAGKGMASAGAMIAAIRMAGECAARRAA
ncbi:4-hydroxythreonine-4-phosphate dehydrogenase [Sphingomonas sp. LH128]|uniref:4-hydroxythreonine-4-phosphate dehydrogenase n=1 Tax=Novosphingobium resinovorum TaxID=158500 RepID=A0A031JZN5_9SPHN|nr:MULTISPECIES: 4-hydroxythreonine-4-phosphate dehydrogenase PdxA [Sphingomonadaceae]AOR76282.1 4-hydroxythreonine-4-phosphate dehydrogenase PdxA [Novosphingobium resinovorum]EJU14270.1 4-hydroxythreonine-4-phosphate dehydrogenase [Sphingomonas sp. LH128]EZP83206.1 4-hydroxythreonine-4-phosphate dehydrogenase [Novosphingobium resinovorum]